MWHPPIHDNHVKHVKRVNHQRHDDTNVQTNCKTNWKHVLSIIEGPFKLGYNTDDR